MICHITTKNDWEKAQNEGEYKIPSLESEGFIHCSTIQQTVETANNFFRGQLNLVLLCIDENKLDAELLYEDPMPVGGQKPNASAVSKYPHVYGVINLSAVINVIDFFPDSNGEFRLPKELG